MELEPITTFAIIIIPIIFYGLDVILHAILDLSIDECGPDLLLLGGSICASRLMELSDKAGMPGRSSDFYSLLSSSQMLFNILLWAVIILWITCLWFVSGEYGKYWKYIGGKYTTGIVAFLFSLFITVIILFSYVINRMEL